jgi:hypothetical protein
MEVMIMEMTMATATITATVTIMEIAEVVRVLAIVVDAKTLE